MEKFTFTGQPRLKLLTDGQIAMIHDHALRTLDACGVQFESEEALKILKDHGARVDFGRKVAWLKPELVLEAIRSAPSHILLHSRDGNPVADLGGDNVYFDPGSAAIRFLESDGRTIRPSHAADLAAISLVNDALPHIALQSTAVVCYDVPKSIGDSYRLYLLLKNSPKPIITGAFSVSGVGHMRDLLAAVAGGADALRERPMAVFDVCPSPPLKWTHISSQNIIDCARNWLPMETVSMPMPGAASPATLAGSILLHTVETLSGLTLAQCACRGAPVVYGGAPVHFDMRHGTTALGAVEATMIAAGYAQMGKFYGLPTHTYACLSDSKLVDAQAGLETAMSATIAQLAGLNVISGPGILEFVSCLSLEKLVIDNEICGLALRLHRGLDCSEEAMAADLIAALGPGGNYLTARHTAAWFRRELHLPTPIIDRRDRNRWQAEGGTDSFQRARLRVREILDGHRPAPLGPDRERGLDRAATKIMDEAGVAHLPLGPR
ncbi:MAG TPA: trimethylamine methyltransferase family protein [Bacillota bacterium]|nr:trimethylamine methyltransferase family protein [Bacillota bacterium]